MSFVTEIAKYKSVSIVGTAKNTGKTECLNYILSGHKNSGKDIAVTSVGVDGETTDIVFKTAKPEIIFYPGMLVQTSEKHYAEREAVCEIVHISDAKTALGRLITARVKHSGKMILSGSPHTKGLIDYVKQTQELGVRTSLIDGALSRMSLASPAVAEAMILCTGAALSASILSLVQKTKFQYDLIQLPLCEDENLRKGLEKIEQGIWGIDKENQIHSLGIESPLLLASNKHKIKKEYPRLYVAGIINDALLEYLRSHKIRLIIPDFTKVFADPMAWNIYVKTCGLPCVIRKTKLLAVCVNPFSPQAYSISSQELQDRIREHLEGIKVYDIRKM